MTMKTIIKKILDNRGITRYRLCKEIGISTQAMDYMLASDSKAVRLTVLIKLQRSSGMSVSQFWKLLESEYSSDD
jgi:DNA-binding Xre family transcriptional regulator